MRLPKRLAWSVIVRLAPHAWFRKAMLATGRDPGHFGAPGLVDHAFAVLTRAETDEARAAPRTPSRMAPPRPSMPGRAAPRSCPHPVEGRPSGISFHDDQAIITHRPPLASPVKTPPRKRTPPQNAKQT